LDAPENEPTNTNEDEEVNMNDEVDIKEEIETKVSQSVKEALSDSSLKDALKGMKVNISISFEED